MAVQAMHWHDSDTENYRFLVMFRLNDSTDDWRYVCEITPDPIEADTWHVAYTDSIHFAQRFVEDAGKNVAKLLVSYHAMARVLAMHPDGRLDGTPMEIIL